MDRTIAHTVMALICIVASLFDHPPLTNILFGFYLLIGVSLWGQSYAVEQAYQPVHDELIFLFMLSAFRVIVPIVIFAGFFISGLFFMAAAGVNFRDNTLILSCMAFSFLFNLINGLMLWKLDRALENTVVALRDNPVACTMGFPPVDALESPFLALGRQGRELLLARIDAGCITKSTARSEDAALFVSANTASSGGMTTSPHSVTPVPVASRVLLPDRCFYAPRATIRKVGQVGGPSVVVSTPP